MKTPAAPRVETRREEEGKAGQFPVLRHLRWEREHPGLVAGITAAGPEADFGIASARSARLLLERCEALAAGLGFASVAVCRQVHGTRIVALERAPPPGFHSPGAADGLACGAADVLLGVTAADCVPVYLLDPATGVVALVHAGWRGTAAGVLEAAAWLLASRFSVSPGRLLVHLGPAICGECYEVGPEVLAALGRPATDRGRVDLRDELAVRAAALGIAPGRISRSDWCTRCHSQRLHSHRGGSPGRMLAFLGRRPRA